MTEGPNTETSGLQLTPNDFGVNTALKASEIANNINKQSSEENEYNFQHEKRGLAVIINNWKFPRLVRADGSIDDGIRHGSKEDGDRLEQSFRKLGFYVGQFHNLEDWQMLCFLTEVATNYNHSNFDCFTCAIMSHGGQITINENEHVDVIYGVNSLPHDPKFVPIRKILRIFNDKSCPSLKGKPRLFFLQACRGNQVDRGIEIPVVTTIVKGLNKRPRRREQVDGNVHIDDNTDNDGAFTLDYVDAGGEKDQVLVPTAPLPLFKDFLVMYASPPGYYAWRGTTEHGYGSWFIIELCRVLNSDIIYRKSLSNCLTIVAGRVAENHKSDTLKTIYPDDTEDVQRQKRKWNKENEMMHGKVVMPEIQSILLKDVVFRRK